jgi:hypothetical protein
VRLEVWILPNAKAGGLSEHTYVSESTPVLVSKDQQTQMLITVIALVSSADHCTSVELLKR